MYSLRFRCLLDHHGSEEISCPKYLGFEGIPTRLFNVRAVDQARAVIEITEGELDAITLEQCGLHAVAVAGASNWKPHYARVFAGFDLVRVWGDGDKAGRRFASEVSSEVGYGARVVRLPDTYDVNKMYLDKGTEAVLALAEEI